MALPWFCLVLPGSALVLRGSAWVCLCSALVLLGSGLGLHCFCLGSASVLPGFVCSGLVLLRFAADNWPPRQGVLRLRPWRMQPCAPQLSKITAGSA